MTALIRPIITEKSIQLAGLRKYTFEVDRRANQIEIAQAATRIYQVQVIHVHVLSVAGQTIRRRKGLGRLRSWKKAILTLKKGQKIAGFELETDQSSVNKSETPSLTASARRPEKKKA